MALFDRLFKKKPDEAQSTAVDSAQPDGPELQSSAADPTGESYEFPGEYAQRFDGVEPSGEAASGWFVNKPNLTLQGSDGAPDEDETSSTSQMHAGGGQEGPAADGQYYVTNVQHSASDPAPDSGWTAGQLEEDSPAPSSEEADNGWYNTKPILQLGADDPSANGIPDGASNTFMVGEAHTGDDTLPPTQTLGDGQTVDPQVSVYGYGGATADYALTPSAAPDDPASPDDATGAGDLLLHRWQQGSDPADPPTGIEAHGGGDAPAAEAGLRSDGELVQAVSDKAEDDAGPALLGQLDESAEMTPLESAESLSVELPDVDDLSAGEALDDL